MRWFWAKKSREKHQKLLQTWRLGAFKRSTFGITWCDPSSQNFGSKWQRAWWWMLAAQKITPRVPTAHSWKKCKNYSKCSKNGIWWVFLLCFEFFQGIWGRGLGVILEFFVGGISGFGVLDPCSWPGVSHSRSDALSFSISVSLSLSLSLYLSIFLYFLSLSLSLFLHPSLSLSLSLSPSSFFSLSLSPSISLSRFLPPLSISFYHSLSLSLSLSHSLSPFLTTSFSTTSTTEWGPRKVGLWHGHTENV